MHGNTDNTDDNQHLIEPDRLGGPLTPKEIVELRKILYLRRQYKWMVSTARLWISYLSTALVSLYVLWDYVEKFLKRIFP